MDLLSVIRRWHFRQGIPIREIKRRTGLSRNTIRKYLRADAVEPVFRVPDRPSKLDPFAEKLTGWLRVEAGKYVGSAWQLVRDAAGLRDFRLHDLRHTFASHAVMSRENLPMIGKLLGHRCIKSTARYAHLDDAHLIDAAEEIGRAIELALAGGR